MNDVNWLLLIFCLAGVFVVYEILGVDPRFKHFHSISYYAQKHRWLAVLIGALFLVGGVVGLIWWVHHLQHPIFK